MVNGTDITLYLSGNNTHLGSLGGAKGAAKVISKQANNGFADLDYAAATTVIDHYACFYVQNDNNLEENIKNMTAYLEFQATSLFQDIKLGRGTAGKNGTEQTIATATTPPVGVTWRAADTFATGVLLDAEFAPGDFCPLWIWRRNRPNTKATKGTKFRLVIGGDPPAAATPGGSGGSGGSGGGSGSGGGGGGTTPPPPPVITDVKLGYGADFSCGSNGQDTIENLVAENCDFYFFGGDYSYEDTAGCFTSKCTAIKAKTIICFGNHEREEGTPQPKLTNDYLQFFGLTKTWYSVVRHGVLFVVMDLYSDHDEGSTQYNDIKQALESNKNNPNINWRFVITHEPWITAPTNHEPEDGQRRIYWEMCQDNDVDIIWHGHAHTYQRSFPCSIPIVEGERDLDALLITNPQDDPNYTRGATGNINEQEHFFVIAGDGGRAHHDLDEDTDIFAKSSGDIYGYSIVEITENGKKLTYKHYTNDKELFDVFSITKV